MALQSRSLASRLAAPAVAAVLAAALAVGPSAAPASASAARLAPRVALASAHPAAAGRRCLLARRALRGRALRRPRRACARRSPAAASSGAAPLYWGAWIGDQLTGDEAPWDMGAVARFEQMTGKSLSLIHFAAPFASCSGPGSCSFYGFPTSPMESVRRHGAIPFFSWSSQSIPSSLNEPEFQLSDVINGNFDSYIRSFAEAAKAWGHPFFLRFDWEMNGGWFPWSEGVNGNGPGEYVAAWRHVHDIFTSVGASNATWVWCPNVDPEGRYQDVSTLYPGDEYVDWTCLDGYDWGSNPGTPADRLSFDRLFGSSYQRITSSIAPSKPMVLGEVGASERGGAKAAWISEMLHEVPARYPKIRALLWFEKFDSGMDWPIETSAAATAAFAQGIAAPSFRGSEYANLGPGPIEPPS